MKRILAILLCCIVTLCAATASACGTYILIWDSSDRLLFEDEVRGYCVKTLGYVRAEILARHGYHFPEGGEYAEHFEHIDYLNLHDIGFPYEEAPDSVTNEEILAGLSDIEQQNIELIDRIVLEKVHSGDDTGFYASWTCNEDYSPYAPPVGDPEWISLPINVRFPVYSGPGEDYLRGDGGQATVHADQDVRAYGFDGDWLMIAYVVDEQTLQSRVGYIHQDDFRRELNHPQCIKTEVWYLYHAPILPLELTDTPMTVTEDTVLTEDPTVSLTPLAELKPGETVTLLMTFMQAYTIDEETVDWAYVEYAGEQPMRGFVRLDALQ